jgi:alginate O-acetyltransferase complex protein AlgI
MSFATWYYPFFLTTISTVFWLLPRGRLAFILLASFVFYSFWDVRFCSLLIAAAASDYLCTRGIEDAPPPPAKVLAIGMLPTAWLLVMGQLKDVAGIHVAASTLACLAFCLLFISCSRLKEENRRRFLLYLAVGVNLGILVFFKYANWFSSGLLALLQRLGFSTDWVLLDVLLPLGISFHTFQSIAYAVDVFNRRCKAERRFWRVLCMIMFFPQLVAGPIERAAGLLPQLRFERRFDWRFVIWGLHLLLLGYFLKVFVADNCGVISDYFFKRIHLGESFGAGWALAATAASVAQIYGDFVGYSYIARGSAILLGVELTRNFELPLLARSPAEFWRRWHISLATWIRDYVFLPLWLSISYRNRSSSSGGPAVNDLVIVSSCLIVTMLLFGLWHGADWHFIAFGGFHGVLQVLWLVVPRAKVLSSSAGFLPRIASRVLTSVFGLFTFVLVCIAWILFRSDTMTDAARVLASAVGDTGADLPSGVAKWLAVHAVPLVLLIALVSKEKEEADLVRRSKVTLAISYFLMIVLLASSGAGREQFIYFQF